MKLPKPPFRPGRFVFISREPHRGCAQIEDRYDAEIATGAVKLASRLDGMRWWNVDSLTRCDQQHPHPKPKRRKR